MQISLILPVYNVEEYLGKCIESCLNQNLPQSEYEIIIVIDGSPDNSIEVARRYQENNTNIKIVERANGGLSAARNTGLKEARGEYVWFIDSDDYIQDNVLSDIVSKMHQNNLDSLWIGWDDVDDQGLKIPPFAKHAHSNDSSVMSGYDFMSNVLNNYLFAWSFIYKTEFLRHNNLYFTEGMYYEDADFAFRSLPLLNRIQLYDKNCYYYLQRKGSITSYTNEKKLKDIAQNCITTSTFLKSCDSSLKRFYQICFTSYYMLFLKEVLKSGNKDFRRYLIEQTAINKFGKVSMFGNNKTKIIGALYNILGVKLCLNILSKIVRV